jgi:hypothetical protein
LGVFGFDLMNIPNFQFCVFEVWEFSIFFLSFWGVFGFHLVNFGGFFVFCFGKSSRVFEFHFVNFGGIVPTHGNILSQIWALKFCFILFPYNQ